MIAITIGHSYSVIISAIPDVYNNFGHFDVLSDSFIIETTDTSVSIAFSEDI